MPSYNTDVNFYRCSLFYNAPKKNRRKTEIRCVLQLKNEATTAGIPLPKPLYDNEIFSQ